MGLSGYSLQAFSFIFALASLPASLVSLVLYTYPALVAIGARAVFGRPITAAHATGLLASFAGVALLVGGARLTAGPGLFWAALSPLVYTAYILAGDRAMRRAPPIAAAALVMTGAAATFTLVAALGGQLRGTTPAGWGLVVAIAVIPTSLAITLFLAALPRLGAGRTALLSTWEPVVTVGLAALLLGERLSVWQAAGGALVLAAVAALARPPRGYPEGHANREPNRNRDLEGQPPRGRG
jgi:drug/metabolite transporter (DMT)-like permease